jgi:hypothetical protein
LKLRDIALVGGLSHPAELFFEGRYGKQLDSEHWVVFRQHMMAPVINKTVDQMAWKMVKNVFMGTEKGNGIVQEEQGFPCFSLQFVEMDGRGRKHRRHVHVEPFLLPWEEGAGVQGVEETVQTRIAAHFLFGHSFRTAWLLFEPHESGCGYLLGLLFQFQDVFLII